MRFNPLKEFTQRDLKLAQRFADKLHQVQTSDTVARMWSERALRKVARQMGMKGKVTSGCFRSAFIVDNLVFKIQKSDITDASGLRAEARYIKKMRSGTYARHFPPTVMVRSSNRKVEVLVQRRVRMDQHKLYSDMAGHVEDLAERLGIEDVHSGNYGWSGRKGREFPIFIDVDFRRARSRGRPKRRRSWIQ